MSFDNTEPLKKSLTVPKAAAEAFELFVNQASRWWPLETHCLAKAEAGEVAVGAIFENHSGGRIFETLRDGRQLEWGSVLHFARHQGMTVLWQLGRPAAEATEWEVRFIPSGERETCVEIEHREWQRLGANAAGMRANYDKGWDFVLGQRFGGLCRGG